MTQWAKRVFIGSTLLVAGLISADGPIPPPGAFSGAPGEGSCYNCHAGPSSVPTFTLSAEGKPWSSYVPGGPPVSLSLEVHHPSLPVYGFQLTLVADSSPSDPRPSAGLSGSPNYVAEQTDPFNRKLVSHWRPTPIGRWSFSWQPPTENLGPLSVYMGIVAANGDATTDGDAISMVRFTLLPTAPTALQAGNVAQLGGSFFLPEGSSVAHLYTLEGRYLRSYTGKGPHALPHKGIFLLQLDGGAFLRIANLSE